VDMASSLKWKFKIKCLQWNNYESFGISILQQKEKLNLIMK